MKQFILFARVGIHSKYSVTPVKTLWEKSFFIGESKIFFGVRYKRWIWIGKKNFRKNVPIAFASSLISNGVEESPM